MCMYAYILIDSVWFIHVLKFRELYTMPVWLAISEVGKNPHGLDWWFCSICFVWIYHCETTNWDPHQIAMAVDQDERRKMILKPEILRFQEIFNPRNQMFGFFHHKRKQTRKNHHWKTTLFAGGSTPKSCWLKGSGTEPGMSEKSKLNSVKELRLVEKNQIREKIYWWLIRLLF